MMKATYAGKFGNIHSAYVEVTGWFQAPRTIHGLSDNGVFWKDSATGVDLPLTISDLMWRALWAHDARREIADAEAELQSTMEAKK